MYIFGPHIFITVDTVHTTDKTGLVRLMYTVVTVRNSIRPTKPVRFDWVDLRLQSKLPESKPTYSRGSTFCQEHPWSTAARNAKKKVLVQFGKFSASNLRVECSGDTPMSVYIYIYIYSIYIYVCIYIYIYIHNIYIHIYICIYAYLYIMSHAYVWHDVCDMTH